MEKYCYLGMLIKEIHSIPNYTRPSVEKIMKLLKPNKRFDSIDDRRIIYFSLMYFTENYNCLLGDVAENNPYFVISGYISYLKQFLSPEQKEYLNKLPGFSGY